MVYTSCLRSCRVNGELKAKAISGQNWNESAHQSIEHWKCDSTSGQAAPHDQPFLATHDQPSQGFLASKKYKKV